MLPPSPPVRVSRRTYDVSGAGCCIQSKPQAQREIVFFKIGHLIFLSIYVYQLIGTAPQTNGLRVFQCM